MILFFRGWMGPLLLLYIVIVVAVCAAALARHGGDAIAGAALLAAAPVVWWLGRRANGTPSETGIWKIFDDWMLSTAGRRPAARESTRPQSLMFIRLEYWSVFTAVAGALILLLRPCAHRFFG
ncbi:MAG TPA: hypothetical protein VFF06_04765 [Polyangia bacterium]|nr:hypothetical protein [Polyangia bacterium]